MSFGKSLHFETFYKNSIFVAIAPSAFNIQFEGVDSQGSLLPALSRSVGRVGENPGNEVGSSPPSKAYLTYVA